MDTINDAGIIYNLTITGVTPNSIIGTMTTNAGYNAVCAGNRRAAVIVQTATGIAYNVTLPGIIRDGNLQAEFKRA